MSKTQVIYRGRSIGFSSRIKDLKRQSQLKGVIIENGVKKRVLFPSYNWHFFELIERGRE